MADTNTVRTLTVRQIQDASGYVAGAREFVAANKEMASSSSIVGAVVSQTQAKISNAADPITRLTRAYDPASAAAIKFNNDLSVLNKQLEAGKVSADAAGRIYAGMVKSFGIAADGTDLMAQGFIKVGGVVSAANTEILQFHQSQVAIQQAAQQLEIMTQRATALKAQLDPVGTSQARLNAELAEYSAMMKSNLITLDQFTRAELVARQRHDEFVNSLNRTPIADNDNGAQFRKQNLGQQILDVGQTAALGAPLGMIALQQGPQIAGIYAMQGGIRALLEDLAGIARIAGPVIAVLGGIYGAYKILSANSAEARLSVDDATAALAAQAAPVSTLQGKVDELAKIQKDYSDAILATASTQDAATKSIIANSQAEFEAKRSLLELELKRQEAAQKQLEASIAIEGLHLRQDIGQQFNQPVPGPVAGGYADPKINGGIPFVRLPDAVSGMDKLSDIIANSPAADKIKEMQANSTLAKIAVDKLREGLDLAFNAGKQLLDQASGTGPGNSTYDKGKAYTEALEKIQAYYHSVYNPPNVDISRVPTPDVRPTNPGAGYAPIDSDADKAATKTANAYEQLLRTVQQRIDQQQLEIQIAGLSAEAQARLRLEFELVSQAQEEAARNDKTLSDTQIAAIKAKADELARYQQIVAGQKFDQGQQDQIDQLRLQGDLIGKSAEEQARANAIYQTDLQMRQQGLAVLGEEADRRRAVAAATAEASVEIQRQQAAYQSLQQAEGSAIDTLITGSGSASDRLKSLADDAAKWLLQMSVANPLKNAWTNTNLPTITDLFSGRPALPNASNTSTAMMNVQASTVMINGSVAGLPGVPGASGLGSLLGYTGPANSNVPAAANQNNPFAAVLANAGTTKTGIPLSSIGVNGQTAQVNSQYAGNFQGFINELQARGYNVDSLGGYNYRTIAGTDKLSNHAFGNAIDINPTVNPVTYPGRGQPMVTNMPSDVSSLAAKYGLEWGGDWNSKKDPMHFEVAKGAQPIAAEQANSSMLKFSQSTNSATKDLSGLGDTSSKLGTSLTDALGGIGKQTTPGALPSNYFPPAPTAPPTGGGFNPFSIFTSLFSLFGFADGTDFSPGGLAWVGERGRELVNLPRGSKVTPNHKLNAVSQGGSQKVTHTHEWNVTVSGNGDKELMGRMQIVADQSFRAMMTDYNDNVLPGRVQFINQNPWSVG